MTTLAPGHVAAFTFESSTDHADPPAAIELDVAVAEPDGAQRRIPGYWVGGRCWAVRLSGRTSGTYRFRTVCSDSGDRGLHDIEGQFTVAPRDDESNPLHRRGSLRVSGNRRYLEHADGSPFFWLGDTWWMALSARLDDAGFDELIARRAAQGFSVIQLTTGLHPDMALGDPRGAAAAGFPWEADYARLNPAFFDAADRRIQKLIAAGLTPCLFACWGYYLLMMGPAKMRQYWRCLLARYSAYPVLFCLAGEGEMPWYLSQTFEHDRQQLRRGWTEIAAYVRQVNRAAYDRPVTMHPTHIGRYQIEDASLLDFDMLQSGHTGFSSIANVVNRLREVRGLDPVLPVVVSELNYENIMGTCGPDIQRASVWSSFLTGAAGYTYGVNGLWQMQGEHEPPYVSPHGAQWGGLKTWREASRQPGADHVAAAGRVLRRYRWHQFQPRTDWLTPRVPTAGIPRQVRVAYLDPDAFWAKPWTWRHLEPDVAYRSLLVHPETGDEIDLGLLKTDGPNASVRKHGDAGTGDMVAPEIRDWLLIIEAADGSARTP